MLQLLLPKEDKFYNLLDQLGRYANLSARDLHQWITDAEQYSATAIQIATTKANAKTVVDTLTREVSNTLITPFDREDLQELSVALYAIPKLIDKIKTRIRNHNLVDRNGDFSRFTVLMTQCADAMDEVLEELSGKLHTKNIPDKVAQLNHLEDQGDELLEQTLIESFRDIEDTRELMLRKGVYQMLEAVTDQYRNAANVALRIVLKHS